MDALTSEFIKNVVIAVHPGSVADPTSIAYLQHLLTPYAQAIEQAVTLESLYTWLDVALPGELAKHSRVEVAKAINKAGEVDDTERLKKARRAVIEYLEGEILDLAGSVSMDTFDRSILPWDIKNAIVHDEELEKMLKQDDNINKLAVTIRIGANDFTHFLTEEFVSGILWYYRAAGQSITLFLYGVPLTDYYLTNEDGSRHDEHVARDGYTPATYLVFMGDEEISFRTPDFLQGAATAAQWLSEEYRTRVTKLRTFDDEGNEVDLTF